MQLHDNLLGNPSKNLPKIEYKSRDLNNIHCIFDYSDDIHVFVKKKQSIKLKITNDTNYYRDLSQFPEVTEAVNSIKNNIDKYGAKSASIYKQFKIIEKAIDETPSPSPDSLVDSILYQLLETISKTIDPDTKSLSLKILNFLSLSNSPKIFDPNIIQLIISIISKSQFGLATNPHNSTKNVIYSYAFFGNLLKFPQYQEQLFHILLESGILSHLKLKSFSLNETRIVFKFLHHFLHLADLHWPDLSDLAFLIPNLVSFFDPIPTYINQHSQIISSFSTHKQVLKCLSIFLSKPSTCMICLENNIHIKIKNYIQTKDLSYYLKCVNLIYANQPDLDVFLNLEFVEKLIGFIEPTDAKGVHEIFSFIFFLSNHGYNEFNQDKLFFAFYNNNEYRDFNYLLECYDFICDMINSHFLQLSAEGEKTIVGFLFELSNQMPIENINKALTAFTTLFSNPQKAELIDNQEFVGFLENILETCDCDSSTTALASNLLKAMNNSSE